MRRPEAWASFERGTPSPLVAPGTVYQRRLHSGSSREGGCPIQRGHTAWRISCEQLRGMALRRSGPWRQPTTPHPWRATPPTLSIAAARRDRGSSRSGLRTLSDLFLGRLEGRPSSPSKTCFGLILVTTSSILLEPRANTDIIEALQSATRFNLCASPAALRYRLPSDEEILGLACILRSQAVQCHPQFQIDLGTQRQSGNSRWGSVR